MIDRVMDSLWAERLAAIERARNDGVKVVGYLPGPYVPEELIYASGALPVCLAFAGSAQTADHALSLLPPVICPFARAQVGEMLLKTNPVYSAIDMLVVPSTCQHLRKTADMWEFYESQDVFKLGVPYDPSEGPAQEYFRSRLEDLKERLESLTGRTITDASLTEAIAVYDRLRGAVRNLSMLRRTAPPAISGLEFMKLNHVSLFADPIRAAEALEAVYRERSADEPVAGAGPATAAQAATDTERPRLMVIGPNIGYGDYGILEMIESAGASVVIEDVFEGVRDCWGDVGGGDGAGGGDGSDPLDALVRARLVDRVRAAFMRSSTGPRLDLTSKIIPWFQVQGVIWYELLCCEFYDQDAFLFENRLRQMGIPMLVIESNYDDVRSGAIRTRLEAFLEIVQGGPADA
ncbi:MAG: 2-hydroxyacyl-CoA dehydratase [Thermoleophilia bacterium]|nr:2-hydroxyacyl-CoA dehydratase [Thermoleophilia bacterium]